MQLTNCDIGINLSELPCS